MIKLFGFTFGDKEVVQVQNPNESSFALPTNAIDDGAVTITGNAHYGTYVDLEGSIRNELELITRYREMSNHPELEMAIDEIVNEAITRSEEGKILDIVMDNLKQPESIKKKIREEFNNVMRMLNFANLADDLFKRWYIDGRIYYHIIVNEKNPKEGIKELRYIDPRKIRKVREVQKDRDPKTGASVIKSIAEYYVYNDRGTTTQTYTALRMIEDAVVIYRLSRAPERRIFYIDVGNLPKGKAEQYLRDVMVKYRNKMVYDATTGELRDDRKHMSMLEDFWLPRREGGKGTEITTLPAGQNLGELEDVKYFRNKLLNALNVPIARLEPQQSGGMIGIGRSTEVTRDEAKFAKFVQRLRNKFTHIFDEALSVQLTLKGICTREEWEEFKEDIYYDFQKDNNFVELRDAELLRERINLLTQVDPFVGRYYSADWVKRHILQLTKEQIEEMNKEIKKEDDDGTGGSVLQQGGESPVSPDEYPPVDNTADEAATESMTPMLDAELDKYSSSMINKK